jgi:protein gp37
MADTSRIEWTEATWNPVTGCTKISSGCRNCYAETMARRLKAMGNPRYANGFSVTMHPDQIELPLRWKKPRTIFVNSMSDLFHEDVPIAFLRAVFDTMGRAGWHRFQVLTKRAGRLRGLASQLTWHPNVWMGVSVEDRDSKCRIADLRSIPAAVRFLSLEPLLEDLGELDLSRISWVIVGGESGHGARPMDPQWVRSIRDQCSESRTPFFFKQWGGARKKEAGRRLDGRYWNDMPRGALMRVCG